MLFHSIIDSNTACGSGADPCYKTKILVPRNMGQALPECGSDNTLRAVSLHRAADFFTGSYPDSVDAPPVWQAVGDKHGTDKILSATVEPSELFV